MISNVSNHKPSLSLPEKTLEPNFLGGFLRCFFLIQNVFIWISLGFQPSDGRVRDVNGSTEAIQGFCIAGQQLSFLFPAIRAIQVKDIRSTWGKSQHVNQLRQNSELCKKMQNGFRVYAVYVNVLNFYYLIDLIYRANAKQELWERTTSYSSRTCMPVSSNLAS